MAGEEYPELNGFAPSWADITTTIDIIGGGTHVDIDYKALNWTSKLSFGEQRGASGGRVIAQTTGSVKNEGSCEYYKSGLAKLIAALLPYAPRRGNQARIGLVRFNINIAHTPVGQIGVFREKMRGCRLAGFESKMLEGDEPETVPMDLAPLECMFIGADGVEVVLL